MTDAAAARRAEKPRVGEPSASRDREHDQHLDAVERCPLHREREFAGAKLQQRRLDREQRTSVEALANNLRTESAAAIAALANDADASLKRNKAASDESFSKLEGIIGDFDLRVANQKDTLELAVEATRTRVVKMEEDK